MTLFKYSRFLCYSIPSFGVSAISPKKSSSNISPTSVIAFVTGWSCYQMKSNIRCKGNTNSTSVIIFLIESQKLPAMVLCLGKPPGRLLLLLFFISFLYLHFIFDLHSFAFRHHPSPFRELSPGFYTHFILSAHCRVIHGTFIFNFSGIFLPRALRFWVGVFYPQAFFTLRSFTDIFDSTCIYQGFPGSR